MTALTLPDRMSLIAEKFRLPRWAGRDGYRVSRLRGTTVFSALMLFATCVFSIVSPGTAQAEDVQAVIRYCTNWHNAPFGAGKCFSSPQESCSFQWSAFQAGGVFKDYSEAGIEPYKPFHPESPGYECWMFGPNGSPNASRHHWGNAPGGYYCPSDDPIHALQGGYTYTGTKRTCNLKPCPQGKARNADGKCVPSAGSQTDQGEQSCTGAATDKPISLGSANKYLIETDLVAGGLRFTRTFNHLNTQAERMLPVWGQDAAEPLGRGWSHRYQARLRVVGDEIWAIRGDGKVYHYQRNSAGGWQTDADITAQLSALPAGSSLGAWQLRDPQNQQVETYGLAGRLRTLTEARGTRINLRYTDGSVSTATGGGYLDAPGTPLAVGLLREITEASGRSLVLDYTRDGRIARVGDGQRSVQYGYDGLGNLVTLTQPDGRSRTYRYGKPANVAGTEAQPYALTAILDENGTRTIDYYYDADGLPVAEAQPGDIGRNDITYTRDGAGNITETKVTDALGATRTYKFTSILGRGYLTSVSQPGGSGCSAATASASYDAHGNLQERTDFVGNKTTYDSYDLARNLETQRTEVGVVSGSTPRCPSGSTFYQSTYGSSCSGGSCWSYSPFEGSQSGKALGYPNEHYSCPAVSSTLGSGNDTMRRTTTEWHPTWRIKTRVAEPRLITTWVYHGQPDPTEGGQTARCAPEGAVSVGSEPIAVLCKRVEQATTDASGSLGFAATAEGSPRLWRYTYNARGQVLREDGPRTDVDDITTYTYFEDSLFDAAGDGHGIGDLASVTDAAGRATTFSTYNRAGQLRRQQAANGTQTEYFYNQRGLLEGERILSGGQERVTTYQYDPRGLLSRVMMPNDYTVFYTYDVAQRLTDISDSQGHSIHYTLDKLGNRTREEVADAEGVLLRVTTRIFDQLGRLQNVVQETSASDGSPQLLDYDTRTSWSPALPALADLGQANTLGIQVSRQPLPATADARYATWGRVRLLDGTTPLADLELDANGKTSFAWTPTTAGKHSLTARYLGTPYSAGSETTGSLQVVSRVATQISLSSTPAATVGVNTLITLSATVLDASGKRLACDPNIPCAKGYDARSTYGYGKVRFYDGAQLIGEVELSEGPDTASLGPTQATLTWALRSTGSHSLTAEYLGTAVSKPARSAPLAVTATDATATETRIVKTSLTPAFYATQMLTLDVGVNALGQTGLPCDQTQKSCPELGYGKLQLLANGVEVATREVFRDFAQRFEWRSTEPGTYRLTVRYLGTRAALPSEASFNVEVKPPLATRTTIPVLGEGLVIGKPSAAIINIEPEANAWLPCFTAPPCYGQVQLKDGETVVGQADVQVYSLFPPQTVGAATGGGGTYLGYSFFPPPPPWPDPNALWAGLGLSGDQTLKPYLRARVIWTPTRSGSYPLTAEYSGGGGLSPSRSGGLTATVSPPLETQMEIKQYAPTDSGLYGLIAVRPESALGQAIRLSIKLINPASYSLACDGTLGACPASGYGLLSLLDNGVEVTRLPITRSSYGGDRNGSEGSKAFAYEALAEYTWVPKTPGSHVLTASYPGSKPNLPATASVTVLVGDAVGTRTEWSTPPSGPRELGSRLSLNVQVRTTAGASLGCDASAGNCSTGGYGRVRFTDNGKLLSEVNLDSAGRASLVWVAAQSGSHALQASFLGTTGYTTSATDAKTITVNAPTGALASSTAWLSAPPASTAVANQVYLRAKVSVAGTTSLSCATTPCSTGGYGSLRFLDGSTVIADVDVASDGTAATYWTPRSVDTRTVTVQYSGSSRYLSSSAQTSVTVSPAATSMRWITTPPAQRTIGAQIPLSVQLGPVLNGALPCDPNLGCGAQSYGVVRFTDGDNLLTKVPVGPSGLVEYVWTPSSEGTHDLKADFVGTSVLARTPLTATVKITTGTPVRVEWQLGERRYRALRTDDLVWQVVPSNGAEFQADASGSYGVIEVFAADGKLIGNATVGRDGKATLPWRPTLGGDQTLTARYRGTGLMQPVDREQLIGVEWIPTKAVWLTPATPDQAIPRTDQPISIRIEPAAGGSLQPCSGTLGCEKYPYGRLEFRVLHPNGQILYQSPELDVPSNGVVSTRWTPNVAGTSVLITVFYGGSGVNHDILPIDLDNGGALKVQVP